MDNNTDPRLALRALPPSPQSDLERTVVSRMVAALMLLEPDSLPLLEPQQVERVLQLADEATWHLWTRGESK